MKKIISVILLSTIISFLFSGCYLMLLGDSQSTEEYIKKKIGVDITGCVIEKDEDTHGGFLGDGEYTVIADCSDIQDKMLDKVCGWKPLPLSENLQLLMYGGEKNGGTYSYEFADENGIPEITHGFYYFINRHDEAKSRYSDEDLFSLYSMNFTLAMYDTDNDMLYYFEYDS